MRKYSIVLAILLYTACGKQPVVTNLLNTDFAIEYNIQYLQNLYSNTIYIDPWMKKPYIVKIAHDIDIEKKWSKTTRSLVLAATKQKKARVYFPLLHKGVLSFDCASLGKGRLSIQLLSPKKKIVLGHYELTSLPFKSLSLAIDTIPADSKLVMEFETDSEKPEYCFIANAFVQHRPNNSKPNVVFISVDALRADAVHCIVPKYNITPNIDALSADGVAFTNHCVVVNWTRPSTIAMLASVYGSATGVNIYYFQVSNQEKKYFYNQSGVLPLPVLFSQHGYITRSIGNNAFILDHTGIGVDLGFDDMSEYQRQWEDTMDIADEVIQWLNANKDKPFFLFINFNAPHNAYIPPPKYLDPLRKSVKGVHPWFRRYLGEVAYTDDYVGRVVATLKKLNLYDNTIIVLTTDHGEVFNSAHEHSPYTDKKSIFTHGQTLFDEEIHVPLIIKFAKDNEVKSAKVAYQVRNVDIAPTVCILAKLPVPDSYQGKSLLPLIEGSEHADRPVYCEGRLMYGVRIDNFKYVEKFYGFGVKPHHWGGAMVDEYYELYDLQKDPEELNNIVNVNTQKAREMQKKLYALRFTQPENVLYAKNDVKGSISVQQGFFYTLESDGKVEKINRQQYTFSLKKGQKLVFSTIPSRTTYYIQSESMVLWGYSGTVLPKVGNRYVFDTTQVLLQKVPDEAALGLFPDDLIVWSKQQKGGIQAVLEDVPISSEMNTLLKQWGYIQNGGAR
ncbi:MAG: sulfatase-like hydrolase/transferase [Spirochaetes bacterium]|nr:sulfatase-like hydrolase/transferase [Spirochaetota bacterium]